jgi:hypothetical protein
MRRGTNSARMAALVFVVAAFLASTCPVMCAAHICPDPSHQASSSACENPAHHSHRQGQQPNHSDCSHQAPNVFLGASGNVFTFSLDTSDYVHIPLPATSSGVNFVLSTRGDKASESAPPLRSGIAIYQKNSDLRI